MSRTSSRVAAAFLLALAFAAGPFVVQAAPSPPGGGEGGAPATGAAAPAALPSPAAAAPSAPRALSPAELLVPSSEFRYDATGRRDPFKSLLELEKKQRDITQLPPIQQFDIETAKVVGIVVDPGSVTQAMIRAPNGQTFVVRVGTVMGKNEGEVVEITMQGIRILEKFVDFMNRETRKETFLKSHPAAGK
ncbi:MAG: pilus assembly protein PilP [Candidatus Methylomirabilia bacterium]